MIFSQNDSDDKSEDLNKSTDELNESPDDGPRVLTTAEKLKRTEMEKTANWWTKYYASKARLKLEKRSKMDFDDVLQDSEEAYAQIFADEASKSMIL